LAWAVQLGANFALNPVTCHQETRVYLWIVSVCTFLAAGFAAWKSWTIWQTTRQAEPADRDEQNVGFLAMTSLGLSALCMLVIFAQSMPTFFFGPCQ
jgi:hypothetical protein